MDTTGMYRPLADDERTASPMVTSDNEWRPLLPVPDGTPDPKKSFFDRFASPGYKFGTGWRYRDADGRLLGFIVRYDCLANGLSVDKQVKPFTFCQGPSGVQEWQCKGFPEPRPLYGLDRLAKRSDAPVLVVEGEKTAEAAYAKFPDFVVVTSPGGANAAGKADWSPLKGRNVTIWPDHDDAGRKYAEAVAGLLEGAKIVHVPTGFSEHWDLADQIPASHSSSSIAEMIRTAKFWNGWEAPTPIISSLPPVESFTPEMLPEAMRGFVFDVTERQQSVPDFVAVAALCGLAAVIGNRFRIAPKQHDDWIEVPNLWGAIIGPPSAMKTPAMQSALGPIYDLEDEMRSAWEAALEEADIDDALREIDAKEAKKKAAKALKEGSRDAARTILAESTKGDEEEQPCPRIVVNDVTVEKLGELLNENPRGLLLIRDELSGFLARLESEEYASERAFYLEAFNGSGRFIYDRIGRGTVSIASCTLNIIGGVQPSRIAPIVRGAMTGTRNDGLIQRLQLAVWPDSRTSWEWVDRHPDGAARGAYEKVFRDLYGLALGKDDEPTVLHFSAAAQAMFQEWMTEIHTEALSGKLSPILQSHLLKMPKTVASLALIFELIEGGRTKVGKRATLRALAWAEYLRSHANRLYSSGNTMIEDGARLILERRRQLPEEFTVRDIYRKDWAGLSDREAVTMAVELLVSTHHSREVEKPAGAFGGRPTASYRWNPLLRET